MTMHKRLLALLLLFVGLPGCTGSPDDWLPLGRQRDLTYHRTVHFLEEVVDSSVTVHERGTVKYQGLTVAVTEYPGGARDYLVGDDKGVRRLATVRGRDGTLRMEDDAHYVLRLPAKVGSHWMLPSAISLIESMFYEAGERIRDRQVPVTLRYTVEATDETVTVPAGTFSNCLRVSAHGSAITRVNMGQNFGHIDVAHTDWYAPGIGLVKSERRETSDSAYLRPGSAVQELVAIEER